MKTYTCEFCGHESDNLYRDHYKESRDCWVKLLNKEGRETFPYLDLRKYSTKAGAAKALYKKLKALDYDAFIQTPAESEAGGYGKCWRVCCEGGPFEWAVKYSMSAWSSERNSRWFTEPHYSFDVCFWD